MCVEYIAFVLFFLIFVLHLLCIHFSAPVGEVDAWWDCGLLLSNSDCFLNWKVRSKMNL